MRLRLMIFLDWIIDDRLFQHGAFLPEAAGGWWHRNVCTRIADSPWWGPEG